MHVYEIHDVDIVDLLRLIKVDILAKFLFMLNVRKTRARARVENAKCELKQTLDLPGGETPFKRESAAPLARKEKKTLSTILGQPARK